MANGNTIKDREQEALSNILKSQQEGGSNVGIAPGSNVPQLLDQSPATRQLVEESIRIQTGQNSARNRPGFGSAVAPPPKRPVITRNTQDGRIGDDGILRDKFGNEIPRFIGTQEQREAGIEVDPQTGVPISRPVVSGFGDFELPERPSEQQIRQQELDKAQAAIDATEALFLAELSRIEKQGAANLGRTSSISVGAGLAGSPFQQAQERKTQASTDEAIRLRKAQRGQEVAAIIAAAEGRATGRFNDRIAQFERERAFVLDERDKALAKQQAEIEAKQVEVEERKKGARESIRTIAESGLSLSELTDQEFEKLLEEGELSEFEARAIFAKNSPQANGQIKIQDGFVVNTYFDPSTGQPVISAVPLPERVRDDREANLKEIVTEDGIFLFDSNNPEPTLIPVGKAPKKESSGLQDKFLSFTEAQALGVPLGTRQSDVFGVTPETKLSDSQSKARIFAKRIEQANPTIDQFAEKFVGTFSRLPGVPEFLKTEDRKLFEQAERNFINAVLRRESGAVISKEEFKEARAQYIPKVGDSEKVLDEKKKTRDIILDEFKREGKLDEPNIASQSIDLRSQFESLGFDESFDEVLEEFGEQRVREIVEQQSPPSPFKNDLSMSLNGSGNRSVLGLGPITGFGSPFWKHGLDIDLQTGDPVPSPVSGVVEFVGTNGGFGNQVRVRTSRGNSVWLSHLDSAAVNVGDRVGVGQFIGRGGKTGKVIPRGGGDGSHLDLTVQKPDGSFVSPREIEQTLRAFG